MQIYAYHIRPNVNSQSNVKAEMFLSLTGNAMTSGQIMRAVQLIWQKAGLKSTVTFKTVCNTSCN